MQAIRDEWASPQAWLDAKEHEAAAARQVAEEAARRAADEAKGREREALPPEERVRGRLEFWILGQRQRGREPTEAEITARQAEMIAQLSLP